MQPEFPGKRANTVLKFSCRLSGISCRSGQVIGWLGWSADVSDICEDLHELHGFYALGGVSESWLS